jgi:hypothetical protein
MYITPMPHLQALTLASADNTLTRRSGALLVVLGLVLTAALLVLGAHPLWMTPAA